jgi:hypothetical protein
MRTFLERQTQETDTSSAFQEADTSSVYKYEQILSLFVEKMLHQGKGEKKNNGSTPG